MGKLGDIFRCSVELDFVLENGVESFNREFSLMEHDGIKIELFGGFFLVSQDLSNLPGLGISLDNAIEDESHEAISNLLQERRFWMLLWLDQSKSQAQISFFSEILKGEERAKILQSLLNSIKQCCERVNRILLLNNLVCVNIFLTQFLEFYSTY